MYFGCLISPCCPKPPLMGDDNDGGGDDDDGRPTEGNFFCISSHSELIRDVCVTWP